MATAINNTVHSPFHNLSPSMLADLIGELDRKSKDAEADLKAAEVVTMRITGAKAAALAA